MIKRNKTANNFAVEFSSMTRNGSGTVNWITLPYLSENIVIKRRSLKTEDGD